MWLFCRTDCDKNFMFSNIMTKILLGKHMLYMKNKEEVKSVIEEFVKR
jgi:hypothetical protein